MAKIVLITGGNRGDVRAMLKSAREMICTNVGDVVAVSSVMESEPWGEMDEKGGMFLNQIVIAETSLSPHELLGVTQEIEIALGREREEEFCQTWRRKKSDSHIYKSREIDIDILFYDDIVLETDTLTIPHPLIEEREFVLVPLAEVAPDLHHPVSGKTAVELLKERYKL